MVKPSPAPLPLIKEVDGVYSVCDEGRRFLECLHEHLPLAVVVVAGRYRSGKSFLMNRGVLNVPMKKGFATGNSTNACTRGVWIYPLPMPTHDNRCFVVLDTEGTASLEAKAAQDARLIGIALSLASIFIFNSSGSLDETSLSDLATLTSVAQGISQDSDMWQPPELVWVLRDFSLKLQGDDGVDISAAEYLERALCEERYGKGEVRKTLKSFFLQRTLFPMVRPSNEETDLQNLSNVKTADLRPEFQKQLENFRNLIKNIAVNPKRIGGISLNGQALVKLAVASVASVNEGNAPSIQTTFDFLQEKRSREYEEEALADLVTQARSIKDRLPCSDLLELQILPQPSFMCHLDDPRRKACEARLILRRDQLSGELALANTDAREKLGAKVLAEAEKGSRNAGDFAGKLESLEANMGAEHAIRLAPRLYEIYVRSLNQTSKESEEKRAESRRQASELEVMLQESQQKQVSLREEVDQALLQVSSGGVSTTSHEEYAQKMLEMREEVQHEMQSLATSRDSIHQELRSYMLQAESQRASEEALEQRSMQEASSLGKLLERAEAQRDGALAEIKESSAFLKTSQRRDLDEIKADFQAIVAHCESRALAAQEACSAAEQRSEHAEELFRGGRLEVEVEMRKLEEQKEASRRENEEIRRKQSQDLMEKKQVMVEAYSNIAQDAQRARESSMCSDRKLMMLEVEKDSLKRRIESLELDGLELAKTRRLLDDVRFKHTAAEAYVESSLKLQEMQKIQIQKLETEVRDVRSAAQQRDLDLTRKTAVLELQLQARGISPLYNQ